MEKDENNNQKKERINLTIREMKIDDIARVFHLGEKLFTARIVPNLYRTWDEYEVISLFQTDPEFCLVAEMDDTIIGFALGLTISKSGSAWKYGHLHWLGVEQKYQRQGIAKKLYKSFMELMVENGVRLLQVDTEADNLPALHFFREMGFGSPQQHIYLSLNLSDLRRQMKKKKENGRT